MALRSVASAAIRCPPAPPLPDVDAVDALPLEALPGEIAELAALQARAAARLHVAAAALHEAPTVDRLLTIDEAATRLRTTKDWLRRQARLPFVDTRHSAVSNLHAAGVPDSVAMSITNHRTTSVFLRYGIRHEQAQRAALESVESYLGALDTRPSDTPLAHGHTADTPRSASRS
jgi:hypothetical protein